MSLNLRELRDKANAATSEDEFEEIKTILRELRNAPPKFDNIRSIFQRLDDAGQSAYAEQIHRSTEKER